MVRFRAPHNLRALLNEVPRRSAALLCLGAASAAAVAAVGVPAAGLAAQDDGGAKAEVPAESPFGADESISDWNTPSVDGSGENAGGVEGMFRPRPSAEPAAADAPATDPPADVTVPGAASVEPVLRAVYRPHPSRVEAVYQFLKANAAPGIDVSLRPSTAEDTRPDAREVVVVAPEPVQRALGAFLQACVSAEPADPAPTRRDHSDSFDPQPIYDDAVRSDFGAARVAPPEPFAGDDFGAAPDAFDGEPFEEPQIAGDSAFDDFDGGEFGDDPARTTRRNPYGVWGSTGLRGGGEVKDEDF